MLSSAEQRRILFYFISHYSHFLKTLFFNGLSLAFILFFFFWNLKAHSSFQHPPLTPSTCPFMAAIGVEETFKANVEIHMSD